MLPDKNTGDLVRTKCFGPKGEVGEVGVLLDYDSLRGSWWVMFGDRQILVSDTGLEVISESKRKD